MIDDEDDSPCNRLKPFFFWLEACVGEHACVHPFIVDEGDIARKVGEEVDMLAM